LDKYEIEEVLDPEFASYSGYRISRCHEIREDYEAFCGTGVYEPVNHIPPDPQITQQERDTYISFHRPRTHLYSCVLPGDIVRQCVESMTQGLLDPIDILDIGCLIVDEYQDLNPADLDFVNLMVDAGLEIFIAGDDDQSLYSFRYATPEGIQEFPTRFPNISDHDLVSCFRCTPNILAPAQNLVARFPHPTRIPKNLISLYEASDPPVSGTVHYWRYRSGIAEARGIAQSCQTLIDAGVPARHIMILLSYTDQQMRTLEPELDALGLPYAAPNRREFINSRYGRFLFALIRIVCNTDDYVAHRLLLGLRPRSGRTICNGIATIAIQSNVNFLAIFYDPIPDGVFSGRQLTHINSTRLLCQSLAGWDGTDTLEDRTEELFEILAGLFGEDASNEWLELANSMPPEIQLDEIRDYFWENTVDRKEQVVLTVYERLGTEPPEEARTRDAIRIHTMHGAKGLDSHVVFIPGLEHEHLPGPKREPYTGLVLEAARMLYGSITRARAACILSFANTRISQGGFTRTSPSTFLRGLGGHFTYRQNNQLGFSNEEVGLILRDISNL
jgi:DNA helicase-2/ATP-dependent DNA helicase PcrA